MLMTRRNSKNTKVSSLLLSCLLVLSSLISFSAGSRNASAEPSPYTPQPEVTPGYTGVLTWMDYTPPGSPINPNATMPFFLDIDADDNIYVTGSSASLNGSGKVEVLSNNGQTVTDITYNAAFKYLTGIAVGADGSVYVADNSHMNGNSGTPNVAKILKLPYGENEWENITYGETIRYAYGVAVDRQGNVYAVDNKSLNQPGQLESRILKLPNGENAWENITENSSVISSPFDIAADGEGNVFISQFSLSGGSSEVFKLPVGGTSWTNITPSGATAFTSYGIDVDQFDNVYVMNMSNATPMKLAYGGGSADWTVVEVKTPSYAQISNIDVAADSRGYLYSTNILRYNINKLMATVIYDGNSPTGGAVPVDSAAYGPGETASVYGNTGSLVKTGHTFEGWNTASDGSGASYGGGDSIHMTKTVTLYAVWTAIPSYTVTLTGIVLDRSAYQLEIGATHQTVATAVYSDESTFALASGVAFTSSNPTVASVDENGLVTAKTSGQTVITAVYENRQAQATVTVPAIYSGETTYVPPGIDVILDGVKQERLATAKKETVNGQTVTTVVLDSQKVIERLQSNNNKLLTIPLTGDHQVVVGQLNGSLVKALESTEAAVQIVTDQATYTLPASQIRIDSIAAQFGSDVKLNDITIHLLISEVSAETAAQAEEAAQRYGAELIARPVSFTVTATYGSRTVEVSQFNSYVERTITLPDGIDPDKITTGVVLTESGDLFHVPTVVEEQDGKPHARMHSLTNSTYAVIYNPREMKDVEIHWARTEINDMTSRLVISGVTATEFRPDAPVSRAEFAAIVTRALGIQVSSGGGFPDVEAGGSFAGAVQAAVNYELVNGYEDGTFRPDQFISRQEAAAILARAMSVAQRTVELSAAEASRLLSAFADGGEAADWARTSVAAAVSLDIMTGRGDELDLTANATRAEAAALVRRFLQAVELINR